MFGSLQALVQFYLHPRHSLFGPLRLPERWINQKPSDPPPPTPVVETPVTSVSTRTRRAPSWDLRGLDRAAAKELLAHQAPGTFAIRYSPDYYATLSIVLPTRLYNAHIERTPQGKQKKKHERTKELK